MKRLGTFAGAALITLMAGAPLQAEVIGWDALPDPAKAFHDPIRALDYAALSDLSRILRLRDRLNSDDVSDVARPRLEGQVQALVAGLGARGVDADRMLALLPETEDRRRRAGLAVNPALEGETVTLSGYAFPGPVGIDGANVAYVVPEIGMCSHTPPPPPNMLVRVRIASGSALETLYQPVRVTGRLVTHYSVEDVFVVDGTQQLVSTVTLDDAELVTMDWPLGWD